MYKVKLDRKGGNGDGDSFRGEILATNLGGYCNVTNHTILAYRMSMLVNPTHPLSN